ncbi:hypothetical protein BDA99DRAFT_524846 [Phascolomyces articulosus]|uniref:Transmembrane protein n=1 Tax=Phascolomyces articulosus TaxID=60185 RepID=A0AAD5JPC9_9FUNG|nr:hypothetical protein BDA99DRAFT_524846 [Phascolomyces articulosus]
MEVAFPSTFIALSSYLIVGSVWQATRSRKYYGRYAIIFFASTFSLIISSTYLAYITGIGYDSIASSMVRVFFDTMFIPLINCLFFEFCRTLIVDAAKNETTYTIDTAAGNKIIDSNNNSGTIPTKAIYAIYTIYVTYLYTFVVAIVAIAFCAMEANNLDAYGNYYMFDLSLVNLEMFKEFGIWAYELFIFIVLILAYNQLRSCIKVLSGYIVFLLIVNIASTVYFSLRINDVCTFFTCNMINFVANYLVGHIGLIYALYISPRYLPSQPKQQTVPLVNQQYFTYTPVPQQQQYFASSPQPPQMFISTTPGSSSPQVYQQQQQYPIVQIPQQQQPGQYQQQQPIILQLPISQQPMNNDFQQQQQYPIVQLQQAPAGNNYYATSQQ